MGMSDSQRAQYAALVLRLVLGALFLAHAWLKIFVYTPSGTAGYFGSLGLPTWLAYVVIIWELVGAVALIIGVWPRVAALALVPILLGAIYNVHGPVGFFFDGEKGGWEYPALWIINLVVLAFIGDGLYVLRPTPRSLTL
jgi:putative oxidoreductase